MVKNTEILFKWISIFILTLIVMNLTYSFIYSIFVKEIITIFGGVTLLFALYGIMFLLNVRIKFSIVPGYEIVDQFIYVDKSHNTKPKKKKKVK
jgi:hypothetical protein